MKRTKKSTSAAVHSRLAVLGLLGFSVVTGVELYGNGSPARAEVLYRVDFEGGDTSAAIGNSRVENMNGGDIIAVDNPLPDAINSSARVGHGQIPQGYVRAELSSQRMPIEGETLVYRWSYYLAADFFSDADINWVAVSQWKTWPCEVCDPAYDPDICGGCGGIFNDMGIDGNEWTIRWRAEPNCEEHTLPLALGRWVSFVQEVHWTKESTGWVRLWMDGALVQSYDNMRTLFVSHESPDCDLYWAVGLYADWSGNKQYLDLYIDDIEISNDPVETPDGGVVPDAGVMPDARVPGSDAATTPDEPKRGCGCAGAQNPAGGGLLVLLLVALAIGRRARQHLVRATKTVGAARLLLLVGALAGTALLGGGCSDDDAGSNTNQSVNDNNANTNDNTSLPGLHEPCVDQCAAPVVCVDALCRQPCPGGDDTDCPQGTRCIEEVCLPTSTVGGPCDEADGNLDCEAGLVCTAGICEPETQQQWVISTFDVAEWTNGDVDTALVTEGSGSLRWSHAEHTSTCLEFAGPTDLSQGELVSLWIHNDVAEPDAGFALVFYSEGGDVYLRVRTDFVGWRRVAVQKDLLTVNATPAGWQGITRICAYATGWSYTPNPSRTIHLDLLHLLALPPTHPPAQFSATFESGSLGADVGVELALTANGGTHSVVANPWMDADNPSSQVLHVQIPPTTGSSTRAEYHTQQMPLEGETYIYSWMEYMPADFLSDTDVSWLVMGQWKTWPCEEYGSGVYEFGDVICYGGGIFNDRELATNQVDFEHRFRAEPDCRQVADPMATGRWVKYALEVHWTNGATGHYSLYKDGALLDQQTNIKTLFDGFIPGECDMRWGLGLYASWTSLGAATLSLYVDDMAVYDTADGVTIQDVLAWQ